MELSKIFRTFCKRARIWNLYTLSLIKRNKCWDKILSLFFKYPSRCYHRKGPLEISKVKNSCSEFRYFSDHFGRFSSFSTLIGKVTKSRGDLELIKELLRIAKEKIKDPMTYELCVSELLSKALSYRSLQKGDEFPIGYLTDNYELKFTTFTVHALIDIWKNYLAFGLIPDAKDAAPILLYRGTDFDLLSKAGRASIISDLDPDGPGSKLYFSSQNKINDWLESKPHPLKARVMGHSLGGALSTHTVLSDYPLINTKPHFPSYSFMPPGFTEDKIDAWQNIPDNSKPTLKTFVTRGDIISKFGNLLGDVFEVSTDKVLSPMIAHEQLVFSQPVCYISKVDIGVENDSTSRRYYSLIQKQTTSIAYRFGLRFLFPSPF